MKIHLAKYEPGRIGGGWTFMRNFYLGMGELITDYTDADIYFISSPSMISRDEVEAAKNDGKKIVLRLDNAVRNSRNRNTGMTRMKDFADWADLIIYQSEWAREYLKSFLHKEGQVILNGIDQTLYYPPSQQPPANTVLYSRFNRDETKNYEAARYWYSQFHVRYPDAILYIVGQFSPELQAGNFDFYNGELYKYLGTLPAENMADVYRNCAKFLYTYFNDACSNTLIEALCSGCEIVGDDYYRNTGGASEIMHLFATRGAEYFTLQRMCEEYRQLMEGIL